VSDSTAEAADEEVEEDLVVEGEEVEEAAAEDDDDEEEELELELELETTAVVEMLLFRPAAVSTFTNASMIASVFEAGTNKFVVLTTGTGGDDSAGLFEVAGSTLDDSTASAVVDDAVAAASATVVDIASVEVDDFG
jgi:hypothetical protein